MKTVPAWVTLAEKTMPGWMTWFVPPLAGLCVVPAYLSLEDEIRLRLHGIKATKACHHLAGTRPASCNHKKEQTDDTTETSELCDHAKVQQLRNKGCYSQGIGLTNECV